MTTQISTFNDRDDEGFGFSYYEYKYRVPHEVLHHVTDLLQEFCGHTDPFPSGIVDSIYYDTLDQSLLRQCINGDAEKVKFRIRGYGDGQYFQLHQKMKSLSGVGKFKCKIIPQQAPREMAPMFDQLAPNTTGDPEFSKIFSNSQNYGIMFPSIRVKYFRYRYRSYDYRITLDTNIEVYSPTNGLPHTRSYAQLPFHVLEIKTTRLRPNLPFIGLIKLEQVSFSKFMIGLDLLNS